MRALLSVIALAIVAVLFAPVRADAARPLRICTANIQHTPDMPDWKVRADAREARAHCDVVLYQEIRERADHRALQAEGWKTTGYRSEGGVPIAWRTSRLKHVTHSRLIRVSDPTPRCANGRSSYNPARYVTYVTLKLRGTSKSFTAVSLHFPQRGRHTCRPAVTDQRWRQAYANTQKALPASALVIGGDWNRREGEIRPMARWHWITPSPRALDHMAVARSGFRVVRKFSHPLHSDHALLGAAVIY